MERAFHQRQGAHSSRRVPKVGLQLGSAMVILTAVLVSVGCPGKPPACDNCQPVQKALYECHHWANDPNGAPCSTTTCIENTLDSASCQYHPDQGGVPNCDTGTTTGPEVVQRIRTAVCPGGRVNWTVWIRIIYGCGSDCSSTTYNKACETTSCNGPLLRGPFNRGVRKKCGCS